jgi:ribosome-associated protein
VNKTHGKSLAGKKLVEVITAAAENKLSENITVIDLTGLAMPADFFVICQSDTGVGNRAIADEIMDACAEKNTRPWHHEGEGEGRWIVIDFTDVVVHIMLPELRRYYDLESLWGGRSIPR